MCCCSWSGAQFWLRRRCRCRCRCSLLLLAWQLFSCGKPSAVASTLIPPAAAIRSPLALPNFPLSSSYRAFKGNFSSLFPRPSSMRDEKLIGCAMLRQIEKLLIGAPPRRISQISELECHCFARLTWEDLGIVLCVISVIVLGFSLQSCEKPLFFFHKHHSSF